MTHGQVLNRGRELLKKAGITEYDNDAWLLFSSSFGLDKAAYYMKSMDEASCKAADEYMGKIHRRMLREPLQYIEEEAYFMGLSFYVNRDVLIPRFDTEILVEQVLNIMPHNSDILDMCTGSGCIAISLSILGDNHVTGVDISEKALAAAQYNKQRNNAAGTGFILSDMFNNITEKYDCIVSNPPYIPTGDITGLEPEVRDNEPVTALDGHEDGLFFYRILAKESPSYLRPGGMVFFETGCGQAASVGQLLEAEAFERIKIIKDYNGLDRVICAEYMPESR